MERPRLGPHHQPAVKALRPAARFLLLCLGLAASPAPATPPDLADTLARHLRQPCFAHATWGVEVVRLADQRTLFSTNALTLLKPASTAKLFTAALALDRLGPEFRIRTDLIPRGPLDRRGTLRGDLIVFGRGDFSWAARFHDGDHTRALSAIADTLLRHGIRRIDGALVADDSYFRGPSHGTGWTWDDLRYYYGAEVGALTTDDNVIDLVFQPGAAEGDPVTLQVHPNTSYLTFDLTAVRTGPAAGPPRLELHRPPGSRLVRAEGILPAGGAVWKDAVPVPEPGRYFAVRLREHLASTGIRIRRGARQEPGAAAPAPAKRRPSFLPPIAVESPTLAEMLPRMLKPSQNLYAQLLLLQVGRQEPSSPPGESTESAGIRALGAFVERVGIPRDQVLLDEGSGLSRSALVTPHALVSLLQVMDRHPAREVFLESFPVAGIDGSLRNRLKDTVAQGNLRAKTGTLRYVNALAGFVTNRVGDRLGFAALLNAFHPAADAPTGREAVEGIARLLAESESAP